MYLYHVFNNFTCTFNIYILFIVKLSIHKKEKNAKFYKISLITWKYLLYVKKLQYNIIFVEL